MDVLMGRGCQSRTSMKIKTLSKLAISRIAILKRNRGVRSSHARSDVVELLNLGHQEQALLRTEVVIKEHNMVDAFSMIEAYCHILVQNIAFLAKKNHKQILPDDLREAMASLTYAAARCGEFPELRELRRVIEHKYGKEFTTRAVQLPSSSGVSPKMVEKLSTRQPSFDSKMTMLKEIAWTSGITLHFGEKTREVEHKDEPISHIPTEEVQEEDEANWEEENLRRGSGSSSHHKYRDVADAAQEAFESAAYAAAAARAAVILSRSEYNGPADHHNDNPMQAIPKIGFGKVYYQSEIKV